MGLSTNNDYKLVEKDRYFKYKFVEALPVKIGVIAESLLMEKQLGVYATCSDYIKKLHNVSLETISVNYMDLTYFSKNNDVVPDLDVLMMPTNYDAFGNKSRWVYTGIYDSSDTYIISAQPEVKLVSSVDFLSMDTESTTLFFLCILSVSFAISFNAFKDKYSSSLKTNCLKSFTKTVFGKIWDIMSLIFFEPMETVSNYLSDRIALTAWFISLSFFYCVLSCYLKSEFFQEEYLVIDNLDQLIRQTRLKPLLMEKAYEYYYIEEKLAIKDESVKNWLDKVHLFPAIEMFAWDFYHELCDGGALVISDIMLKWSFGALMDWGETDEIQTILKKGGFYVSRSIVRSELLMVPVDRRIFNKYPIFREMYTVGMMSFFETKTFYNMDIYNKYPLDLASWSTPIKTETQITLLAVSAPFYVILPIGFSISFLALLMECLTSPEGFKMGRFKFGRSNRINATEENHDLKETENHANDQASIEDKLNNDVEPMENELDNEVQPMENELDNEVQPMENELDNEVKPEDKLGNEVASKEENQENREQVEVVEDWTHEEGEIRLRTWSNIARRGHNQPPRIFVSKKEGDTRVLAWENSPTSENNDLDGPMLV